MEHAKSEQEVPTIIFFYPKSLEIFLSSFTFFSSKSLFQTFLPSIIPAIKILFEFLINSKASKFYFHK